MTKIWINKEGAPMVSRNGWPKEPLPGIPSEMAFWRSRMDLAKRDAVPLDTSHEQTAQCLRFRRINCDTLIDVDIEVDFVHQWKWLDGWRDCSEQEFKERISNNNKTRTIARVVPAKEEIGNSCKHCGAKENQDCQHGGGECPWADEAASDNYLTASEKQDNGAHSYTEAMDLNMKGKDWDEDFNHENGNYYNKCIECGSMFRGHKRRVICKECMQPNWEEIAKKQAPPDNKCAHAGCWGEGEMVGFARCMVKEVTPLKQQLAAAQERVKELEDALEAAQSLIDGYENTLTEKTKRTEQYKELCDKAGLDIELLD